MITAVLNSVSVDIAFSFWGHFNACFPQNLKAYGLQQCKKSNWYIMAGHVCKSVMKRTSDQHVCENQSPLLKLELPCKISNLKNSSLLKWAYFAVCELTSPSMSDFLWGLENSGWLKHIKAIMDAGIFITKVQYMLCK